ncbi:hypothetical protein TrLO_g4458 [Triparma laevis f. longispina]|uniref:J domain-containing protein n=1 Tax=Triparma laevis f. longispina TaxID=1714387 RepID=A0A9W7FSP6_9STRA|nr:hypothetical protein TrLO_g4458 [Triparma laevis f. longispina]
MMNKKPFPSSSAPKDFSSGLSSGLSQTVSGVAMGGAVVVGLPVAGSAIGAKNGGVLGAVFGLAGGAVLGGIGAAGIVVGSAVGGVAQVVQGVINAPAAAIQPRRGKRWCIRTGRWVLENLELEEAPDNDDDLIHEKSKLEKGPSKPHKTDTNVVDTSYYDTLNVEPDADYSTIRKNYYKIARDTHPDRAGDDPEKAKTFKEAAEAFQVLGDTELRAKFDKEGQTGLSADRTEVANVSNVDPTLLFSYLFGSDQFNAYVGRLALATAAIIDENDITTADANELQRRRCARLAKTLATKLDVYLDSGENKCDWQIEALRLAETSYGKQMLFAIGNAYALTATQFLGAFDSGIGTPSIQAWAKSWRAGHRERKVERKAKISALTSAFKSAKVSAKASADRAAAQDDHARKDVDAKLQHDAIPHVVNIFWSTTVCDITATLHEVCEKVLFDHAVTVNRRKARANALLSLGAEFTNVVIQSSSSKSHNLPEHPDFSEAEAVFQEATLQAQLETIRRAEEKTAGAHRMSATPEGSKGEEID